LFFSSRPSSCFFFFSREWIAYAPFSFCNLYSRAHFLLFFLLLLPESVPPPSFHSWFKQPSLSLQRDRWRSQLLSSYRRAFRQCNPSSSNEAKFFLFKHERLGGAPSPRRVCRPETPPFGKFSLLFFPFMPGCVRN